MCWRGVYRIMSLYTCKTCHKVLPSVLFSPSKECATGLDLSRCKDCKLVKAKKEWARSKGSPRQILNRINSRAKKKGVTCTLVVADIKVPDVCPVFGTPLVYGDHKNTPSIDRIIPSIGYTKENICVISNRANMLKGDATSEELFRVAEWLREEEQKREVK